MLIVVALSVLYLNNNALAIDTGDWEKQGFVYMFPKPANEWLAKAGYQIMGGAYPKKDINYFYRFINAKSNTITIKPAKPWHDINKLVAYYGKTDKNYDIYSVMYYIKNNVMTLLDVINRYGVDFSEIETNNDLSKQITYTLTQKNHLNGSLANTKAEKLYYMSNHLMTVTFISSDKVFVDRIIYAFVPSITQVAE